MAYLVKICGLNDAASVDAALQAGADAVGFVFADSVRRVTPAHAADISRAVPKSVLRVAVMLHPTLQQWQEVGNIFRPDVLQTDAADFEYLDVPDEVARWPVIREGKLSGKPRLPGTFVYEGRRSGRGEAVDWQVAAEIAGRGRMILAGGLNCDNVAQAIRTVAPYGVDVSSAVEASPGIKDAALIREFVAAVRATEKPQQDS